MGVGESFADLGGDVDRFRYRELPAKLAQIFGDGLEVSAVHELHDDEVRVVAHTDVEHLDHVRVAQEGAETRLVEEHRDELLLLAQVRKDALDGDLLLEALDSSAFGAEHFGHSAGGQLLDDSIALLLG